MVALEALWNAHADLWHSLWLNGNKRRDNVIFGSEWCLIKGEQWLWEELQGRKVCLHPASFAQANLEMFDRLLGVLRPFLKDGANLLEFYAGVGAIGLSVVERCRRVRCVEIAPLAKECFEMSRARLPAELAERISFIQGPTAAYLKLLDDNPDVVIVDPPRKGLERAVVEALCKPAPGRRLIYISCGWESFQRDCERLLKGGWKLTHAEAFLFFPGSDHLETLAIFDQ